MTDSGPQLSRDGNVAAGSGDQPLVSVIMATYNCKDTLQEAIDSLKGQTYGNWELVVCDDASTDGTYEQLKRLSDEMPQRVTLLQNEKNSKLAFSLNRCLEHAKGSLVARMDADDLSAENRFATQVQFLVEHPIVDLVGTAIHRFDEQGLSNVVRLTPWPDRFSLRAGVPFVHATVMARRHVFDDLGGYTVSRRTVRGQDYDLWFRFFHRGFEGHNISEPLYLVREDLQAIRRRTLGTRFQSYQTTLIGFSMLHYPLSWYVRPTVMLLKGLVPSRLYSAHRKRQKRRYLAAQRANGRRSISAL